MKSRLASTMGALASSRLYRSFLECLLRRLDHIGQRRTMAYSPADRAEAFGELAGPEWELLPQGEGNLGQRLERVLATSLQDDDARVVVIGSDSPTLPSEFLQRAFTALKQWPVVLGPAEDGGYYLVGARGNVPPIFHDMPWSSPRVWVQTVGRLHAAGIAFHVLPTWYDVDTALDLTRLREELTELAQRCEGWTRLSRALEEVIGDSPT